MPDYSGRDWKERTFTVGIGGPVGSGKTALLLALCRALRDDYNIGACSPPSIPSHFFSSLADWTAQCSYLRACAALECGVLGTRRCLVGQPG